MWWTTRCLHHLGMLGEGTAMEKKIWGEQELYGSFLARLAGTLLSLPLLHGTTCS